MSTAPRLDRILAFRLTTADPQGLRRFYIEGVGGADAGCSAISQTELSDIGLSGHGQRTSLTLGDQRLDLDAFTQRGRPYPNESSACDLIFQHCAIVVSDARAAYRRALEHGATPISDEGPVELPAAQGSVIAVKFRDPEGHPLEFLQFPPWGHAFWTRKSLSRPGTLGVDHSAIAVANAESSAKFYEAHGLGLGKQTLNQGPTQAMLDGLRDPQVDVLPMIPSAPSPHLEILGYRRPCGRTAPHSSANDIAATRLVWASDRAGLMPDPDGHLQQLEPLLK